MFLPYGRQAIDEDDIGVVSDVLRSDFLTTGPKIAEFETALTEITGAAQAVVCSNGTAALHLAGLMMDLGPGDAVIVPSVTFLATANAVRYCGAEVIFADVDPDTGLMGAGHVQEALARAGDLHVKAIFAVHLAGMCADLKALSELSKAQGLKLLADAAHALGGKCYGHPVGACLYEDFATFSFHPVKTIATGEGGAVMTQDAAAAEKMRALRSHGMAARPDQGPWAYEMTDLGYNYRLTDIQCALGLSQLKKLKRFVARRQELVALYNERLADLAPLILPPAAAPEYCDPAWHLYAPRIDFSAAGIDRAELMTALREKGIGSQVHYIPVHTQPYYAARYGALDLPGAMHYYDRTLSLPLFPAMRDEDVGKVVAVLKEAVRL